ARRYLELQDSQLRQFPEVASVYGKIGAADSATDPAPMNMVETVVRLKPEGEWPLLLQQRWYSGRANWLGKAFGWIWPETRRRTHEELEQALSRAVALPGFSQSFTMPIRARIDMQSTGIKTPLGLKIFGASLRDIETVGQSLEGL